MHVVCNNQPLLICVCLSERVGGTAGFIMGMNSSKSASFDDKASKGDDVYVVIDLNTLVMRAPSHTFRRHTPRDAVFLYQPLRYVAAIEV